MVRAPEGERLECLANHLTLGASTVARICRDRWRIEPFFNALKQNLRVKAFVGTSANALHIQAWTALIALLTRPSPVRRRTPTLSKARWRSDNSDSILGGVV